MTYTLHSQGACSSSLLRAEGGISKPTVPVSTLVASSLKITFLTDTL